MVAIYLFFFIRVRVIPILCFNSPSTLNGRRLLIYLNIFFIMNRRLKATGYLL